MVFKDVNRKGVGNMWGKDIRAKTYKTGGQVLMIPVEEIRPNPDQPRREFDQGKLLELAQSIGENGIIHPLTVMMWSGQPVLIAGERRLRAAKIAGIRTVPCLVTEVQRTEAALLALVENLQREDMNCFEEAEGIHRLIGLYGLTQEEAAFRLGCSQPAVANKLRLLRLQPEERRQIIAAGLTERHAPCAAAADTGGTADIGAPAGDRGQADGGADRAVGGRLAGRESAAPPADADGKGCAGVFPHGRSCGGYHAPLRHCGEGRAQRN